MWAVCVNTHVSHPLNGARLAGLQSVVTLPSNLGLFGFKVRTGAPLGIGQVIFIRMSSRYV